MYYYYYVFGLSDLEVTGNIWNDQASSTFAQIGIRSHQYLIKLDLAAQ